ncbi:MAG: hypothetical protein Q9208_007729 [Pyrenodesmia sp. 3 TL-2023]
MSEAREDSPTSHVRATQTGRPSRSSTFGVQATSAFMRTEMEGTEDRIAQLRLARRQKPIEPIDLPLPSQTLRPVFKDPDDPLVTEWQKALWIEFANYGRLGIALLYYRTAKEAQADPTKANVHWEKLLADESTGKYRIFHQLMGLTDDAIRSLIRNPLPHDTTLPEARDLMSFTKDCMTPTAAPSIYCMAIASSTESIPVAGEKSPGQHAGKYLSSVDHQRMVDKCEDYINDAPHARALNQAIDDFEQKEIWNGPGRRFSSEVLNQWLPKFRDTYGGKVDPAKVAVPWTKVPFEVGLAVNTQERLEQHATNSGTSSPWALVHALTRLPADAPTTQGFSFPSPRRWELFPLIEDDEEYAQLAEINGCLLCSTYSSHGGLNPTLAGTASFSAHVASLGPDDAKWNEQICNLAERIERAECPAIEEARYDKLRRGLAALRSWKAKKAECEELSKAENEKQLARETAEDRWKQVLQEVDALRKQLAEAQQERALAPEDPWARKVAEAKRQFEEASLVDETCRQSTVDCPDAQKIYMDERGVPENIRQRVEARREKNLKTATEELEDLFGSGRTRVASKQSAEHPQPPKAPVNADFSGTQYVSPESEEDLSPPRELNQDELDRLVAKILQPSDDEEDIIGFCPSDRDVSEEADH